MTGGSLQRRVVRSGVALAAGRLVMAGLRLAIAAVIVRQLGAAVFAEYAVVLTLVALAEWMLDYGTVETLVRDILREPTARDRLLRVGIAAKAIQVPVALALLATALLALRYPAQVVEAGMVAGIGLFFLAGVTVVRVVFKATLRLEREVFAELASVVFMLPMVVAVASYGGGIMALMAAQAASRALFLLFAIYMARSEALPLRPAPLGEARDLLRAALPIGTIGLCVAAYESVDVLMLSKLAGAHDVAYFTASQRMVWPVLMALGAIGGTLYPVAAAHWPRAPDQFRAACQMASDTVVVLAGLAAASFLAGAEFYLRLLGPALLPGADALRLIAVLMFVKALTSTLGPILYIVHAQKHALGYIAFAAVLKIPAAYLLALNYGYLGVAAGAIAVEALSALAPTLYWLRKRGGFRLDWNVPLRAAAFAALTGWAAHLADHSGGLVACLLAPAGYALLVLATRTVPAGRLLALVPGAGR
ncbi:MAG TPA: oligosaccharide flippase family protein [Usitatibacter sp.]|nr:oligosaccharide flippase family protein [Usitatibacter sp.]